ADVLRAPHQDRYLVAPRQHAAVDADVHDTGVGILGHASAVGDDVAAAVEPVPIGRRKLIKIDVLAGDLVLLHRAVFDDARGDAAVEDAAADLHQFARMGVGRKAQHHGDAAIAREAATEHAAAAARRF